MPNRGEIRGLIGGRYEGDKSCSVDIYKDDNGTNIIHCDFDYDIYYHWVIDENGDVKFELGSPFELDIDLDSA